MKCSTCYQHGPSFVLSFLGSARTAHRARCKGTAGRQLAQKAKGRAFDGLQAHSSIPVGNVVGILSGGAELWQAAACVFMYVWIPGDL